MSCDLTPGQHQAYVKHIHDLWLHVPYENQNVMQDLKRSTGCWAGPTDAEVLGRLKHKVQKAAHAHARTCTPKAR